MSTSTILALTLKPTVDGTEIIEISENGTGSFRTTLSAIVANYQLLSEKGAINGYAGLDASQELLLTNFPTGTGLQILRRNVANTALEFATISTGGTWTDTSTNTGTNKTLSVDLNSIIQDTPAVGEYLRDNGTKFVGSAILAADLPTAIDAAKIADGSVSNAEFQFINTVTSNVQTQINNRLSNVMGASEIYVGSGSFVGLLATVSGDLTMQGGTANFTIIDNAVTLAKMAGGIDGNLITYDTLGDPAFVATGDSGEVLTSNGVGTAPTFQVAASGGITTLNTLTATTQTFAVAQADELAISSVTSTHTFSIGANIPRLDEAQTFTADQTLSKSSVALLQVESDSIADILIDTYNATFGAAVELRRGRGTRASPTALADTDNIGTLNFAGYDGSTFTTAANISALVNGAVSSGVVDADLLFKVSNSGVVAEAVRIQKDKTLLLSGTFDANSQTINNFIYDNDVTSNAITNLVDASIKAGAAIAGSKLNVASSDLSDSSNIPLLDAINAFTGRISVTNGTFPPIQGTRTSGFNNVINSVTATKHKTSVDMLDGFGVGHVYQIEDSADVENNIGRIAYMRDGGDTLGKLVVGVNSAFNAVLTIGTTGLVDWPLALAHTGIKIDANGTGNAITNIDVADLANGVDGELITWDAAGVPATVGVGTAAQVLTSNGPGTAPTFQANPAGFADPMTTRGDIIIRNASNVTDRLAIGANTFVLTSDGTDIAWAAAGAGSQTPWTQDIDADTFALTWTDVDAAAPAGTVEYFTNLAAGLVSNVATGLIHDWQVNNVSQMTVSVSTIDFQGNTLTDILDITSITSLNGVAIGDYILTSDNAFTIAGTGLTSSGSTVNVIGTSNRILINANSIDIDAAYVGQVSITSLGTIANGTWGSSATTIAVLSGGTGVTTSTGTTNVVLSNSPTIVTPTIASFVNATHNHQAAAGGGTLLSTAALSDTGDITYLNTANVFGAFNQDFTSATMRIPVSAAPTMAVNGDFALDTTVTDFDEGVLKYFSTVEYGIVAMPITEFGTPTNNDVITYDSTLNNFKLAPAAGSSPLTTKGDLFTYTTVDFALPIGATNGDVLTIDSGEASGMKWAAAAGGSGFNETVVRTADDTTAEDTVLTLDSELFLTLAVGVYSVEARIICIPGAGPSTFKYDFGGTATFDNTSTIISWDGAADQSMGAWGDDRTAASSGTNRSFTISGTLNVTVTGTFGIRWAQGTTSTNVTTIVKGSSLSIKQTNSGAGGVTPPFADTQTIIEGSADATKLLRFEIDGFDAATTRILTPPNANIIIAGSDFANVWGAVNQNIAATGKWQEAGVNISPIGDHDQYLTAGFFNEVTTGAIATRILGTGDNRKAIALYPFTNGVNEFIVAKYIPPTNYDGGTFTIIVDWTTETEGAGNVLWAVAGVFVTDGDDLTAAATNYGTEVILTADTQSTINFEEHTARSAAVTPANTYVAGDALYIRIQRRGADGGDTFTQIAQLMGVNTRITTDGAVAI